MSTLSYNAKARLFNAVSDVLNELALDTPNPAEAFVYFSDRLVCTDKIEQYIRAWFEQHRHGETLPYEEHLEAGNGG